MSQQPITVAVLGVGQVGAAVLTELAPLVREGVVRVVAAANSAAVLIDSQGLASQDVVTRLDQARGQDQRYRPERFLADLIDSTAEVRPDFVVDTTASEVIAAQHAALLGAGLHVVTANKLGLSVGLERWRDIEGARLDGAVQVMRPDTEPIGPRAAYGDSCVVGAGLPMLATIRRLVRSGDRVLELQGVLSGTLAVLMSTYDSRRPFADAVHDAVAQGLCEPDPWEDLSGGDVERKLLALARASGHLVECDDIDRTPLYPSDRRGDFEALNVHIAEMFNRARAANKTVAYIAKLTVGAEGVSASVGPQLVDPQSLIASSGGVNTLIIRSERYCDAPVVVQGPGAGTKVTAGGIVHDILDIAGRTRSLPFLRFDVTGQENVWRSVEKSDAGDEPSAATHSTFL